MLKKGTFVNKNLVFETPISECFVHLLIKVLGKLRDRKVHGNFQHF